MRRVSELRCSADVARSKTHVARVYMLATDKLLESRGQIVSAQRVGDTAVTITL